MSRILFVGSFVSNELEQKSKYISSAGNRFQNNVIEHLEKAGHQVMRMSYLGVPLEEEERRELPVYCIAKNGNLLQSVIRFQKWLKHEIQKTDIVICYNVIYAWLNLPYLAKKYGKRSIVILADYSDERSCSSWRLKVYAKMQRRSIRKYNKVVGLSKNIEYICKAKQVFMQMEGGIDELFYNEFENAKQLQISELITYMYSGLLSKVTGVDLLLNAFVKMNIPNARLVITGKGPMEEMVKRAAQEDVRIEYRGSVPYNQYVELLKQADVLVNPRNMELPENQNNFPSKIMDYLATGKPIVSTRFVGWEKFQPYIEFTENSIESLADAMRKMNIKQHKFDNRIYAQKFLWSTEIDKILQNDENPEW